MAETILGTNLFVRHFLSNFDTNPFQISTEEEGKIRSPSLENEMMFVSFDAYLAAEIKFTILS